MRYLWNPNLTGPVNTFLVFRYLVLGIGFIVIMNFVGKCQPDKCPEKERWIKSRQFQIKVRNIERFDGMGHRCYKISGIGQKGHISLSYFVISRFANYISTGDSLIKNENTMDFILVKRDSTFVLTESCT